MPLATVPTGTVRTETKDVVRDRRRRRSERADAATGMRGVESLVRAGSVNDQSMAGWLAGFERAMGGGRQGGGGVRSVQRSPVERKTRADA